jgi:hypothetical protein
VAGTIFLDQDNLWSASGWLFDRVVTFLAEGAADPAVEADLRQIVAAHIGCLVLEDYGPETAAELRAALRDRLMPAAADWLSDPVPARPAVVDHVQTLARQAGASGPKGRRSGDQPR